LPRSSLVAFHVVARSACAPVLNLHKDCNSMTWVNADEW